MHERRISCSFSDAHGAAMTIPLIPFKINMRATSEHERKQSAPRKHTIGNAIPEMTFNNLSRNSSTNRSTVQCRANIHIMLLNLQRAVPGLVLAILALPVQHRSVRGPEESLVVPEPPQDGFVPPDSRRNTSDACETPCGYFVKPHAPFKAVRNSVKTLCFSKTKLQMSNQGPR